MSNVTRSALRVYSAISELKGKDKDVLDALIPFFEPIFSIMNGKIFEPHIFSAGVRKLYRWRFTGDIAAMFIPRLEKAGILTRAAKTAQGTMWIVKYDEARAGNEQQTIVTAVEKIIDEFEKFPPRVTDLLSYKKNRDELKDILIRFLVTMDAQGEGAYAAQLGDLAPNGEAGDLVAQLEEGGRPLDANDRYMCARFVQHLMRRKPEFVPHLTRLASIALLTEVVEDFLKPTTEEEKTDLSIVLDAPIALDLLGCSGKALKDDVLTIVNALRKIGVNFVVFPISCVEMQQNLRSMLSLPVELRHGYTHNAIIKKEVSVDFVQAVANNPERALSSIGITVRQIDLNTLPHAHRYFTAEQHEDFFGSITWGNRLAAREHDAACLTNVMRLREGRHSSDIFKNRFVMVTRNSTFVRNSRIYCLQSRMINPMQEGPIVHARELATTAWLRTGLGADETIPRGHLIATCDRVLTVRPEVRNALAAQLTKITPERLEHFNLLMRDARSVQKLADETLNNENVISPDNAEHLLRVMREATADELKEKHKAELEAERETASAELERKSNEMLLLSEEIALLRAREKEALELTEKKISRLVNSINSKAKIFEIIVGAFLLAVGAAALLNMFTGFIEGSKIWGVVLILGGVAGFFRLYYGLMEKPMPALGSALNFYCRFSLRRNLSAVELDGLSSRLKIKAGRVIISDVAENSIE